MFLSFSFISFFYIFWVGKDYLLDSTSFVLLVIYAFIAMTRTNDSFIVAYGLFQDVYAPVVEAILNLGLSVVLGYYYGLAGIIGGVIISLLFIAYGWKPYFLYSRGFKLPFKGYVLYISKILFMIIGSYSISQCFFMYVWQGVLCENIVEWIIHSLCVLSIHGIISLCVFFFLDKAFRSFIYRFLSS